MAGEDSRPGAHEIYERVVRDGLDELDRPLSSLGFSGLSAGITIGLSALGAAGTLTLLGAE